MQSNETAYYLSLSEQIKRLLLRKSFVKCLWLGIKNEYRTLIGVDDEPNDVKNNTGKSSTRRNQDVVAQFEQIIEGMIQ
jgi:uncharacterized protein YnzC (UPF0291/DUF896 family)